jgi:D-3-phosphoglycerate dehydrogenase / 2-oxoglutarate reductase
MKNPPDSLAGRPTLLVDPGALARREDLERLARTAEVRIPEGDAALSEEALIGALQGCAGLVRLGGRLPELSRRVLEATPDLRVVSLGSDRFGKGIDVETAWERGIRIIDTDNIASAHPVAEWVLGLILVCLRNGGAMYRQMMAGSEQWASTQNETFVSGELTERRVGLIGCGHVGQRLVELLAPFRVDLRVFDPYLSEETAARLGIVRAELEAVLRHAEILVLQVPHTPKTERLIGERELDLLGPGKIFINCSRGKNVDQDALIRRLETGDLIAGLDVFDPEPLPKESPLRHMPNVFATPHIAWNAPNAKHRYFGYAVEELERYFAGQPLRFELTRRMVDIRHGRV